MKSPRPRLVVATLVLGASVFHGIGQASAAPGDPLVDPGGGCWRYVPGDGEDETESADVTDVEGITDLSEQLEPWVPEPGEPGVALTTAGATAVGGLRTFAVEIPAGPVVDPAPAAPEPGAEPTPEPGVVTLLLAVGDSDLPPVEVDIEVAPPAEAGDVATVPAITAEGSFLLSAPGETTLTLRAMYVDLPGLDLRIACNGQTEGVPGGDNPATAPLDTAVATTFPVAPGSGTVVTAIRDQAVLTAARAGDTVVVDGVGYPAATTGALQWCLADATCREAADLAVGADGAWRGEAVVPDDLPAGDAALRSTVGDEVVDLPVTVLGAPTVAAEVRGKGDKVRAAVDGAGWDPTRVVRLVPVDDDGERAGRAVEVAAGAGGAFTATVGLTKDAVAVTATQRRTTGELSADVQVELPTAVAPTKPGKKTAGVAAPRNETAVVAPVDIPEPAPMPIAQVPAPLPTDPGAVADPAAGPLAVVDAELEGSPTMGEMFGASPRRVLRLTVENTGDTTVTAPGLTIAVGRTGDAEPIYESDGLGTIEPGATEVIEVPIALGVGAMGTYEITGQVGAGEAGQFQITWQTFPWGLIGLNVLGIALVAWAVERRVAVRHKPTVVAAVAAGAPAAAGAPLPTAATAGEAVVDLETLERWWALPAGTTVEGIVPDAAAMTPAAEPGDGLSVVDVDAAEAWFGSLPVRDVTPR